VDGDGTPDCVLADQLGNLVAVSGKDGGVLDAFPGSADKARSAVRGTRVVFGARDRHVREVDLRAHRPIARIAGFAAGRSPAPLQRMLAAIREAVWRFPEGNTVAAACAELLESEKDKPTRFHLWILRASALLEQVKAADAKAALEALRAAGGASYAMHVYRYLCDPNPDSIVAALRTDPERACALLLSRTMSDDRTEPSIHQAAASLAGLARAAAYILTSDFDLALADLHAEEAGGMPAERIARFRKFFPADPAPYLERAEELEAEPARASALALLALARASGDAYAAAAVRAARAFAALKDTRKAIAVLELALGRDDLSSEARRLVEEARKSLK
jgi:hypothetical protein